MAYSDAPLKECIECPSSHNGLNGLFCDKLNKYIQYTRIVLCDNNKQVGHMETKQLAIIKPESIQMIVQAAPQSFNENRISHDRCIAAGMGILQSINAEGMTDELDKKAASFIDKARRTVKAMNEKRSPVTKLFDEIRSTFTILENEIDPSKSGTVPYQLQQHRNQYAAMKRAEEERRRQEEMKRIKAEQELAKFRNDLEDDFKQQFQALVNRALNQINSVDNNLTLDNYEQSMIVLKNIQAESKGVPVAWVEECLHATIRIPSGIDISAEESDMKTKLLKQFDQQYALEVGDTVGAVIDRMPSKKTQLEKIAVANAEEAERLRQQMGQREREEAQRQEAERIKREQEEKAKTEMERKAGQMTSLFDAQAASSYQPKAKVTKKLNVLNPDGIMQVISLWWSKEGCNMTTEELSKVFKKQITFCEKLANKEGVFIEHESIEYVDEVKAK